MNMMRLYEQLKEDEGVVSEIYLDHLGYKTFGIGHLVKKEDPEWNLPVGTTIKAKRIQDCFKEDVAQAVKDCEALYQDYFEQWPEEVQEILVNMIFNLGKSKLSKFKTFKKYLERNDWEKAAEAGRDSLWYTQVPKRAERLMSRLENVT